MQTSSVSLISSPALHKCSHGVMTSAYSSVRDPRFGEALAKHTGKKARCRAEDLTTTDDAIANSPMM